MRAEGAAGRANARGLGDALRSGGRPRRAALALAAVAVAAGCAAPEPADPPSIAAIRAWSVFEADGPDGRICFAATRPLEADGVEGARDSFLMATLQPGAGPEVTYMPGFEPAGGGAELAVGDARYAMFLDDGQAWLVDPSQEPELVDALRRGATAQARAAVADGRRVATERYSLMGFTAAVEEARRRCA